MRKMEDSSATAESIRLRERLAAWEGLAGLGPDHIFPQSPLEAQAQRAAIQRWIGPGRVLLSFLPGDRESTLWAVTETRFERHALPPRAELASLTERWRSALLAGSASAGELGRALSASLFGPLSPAARSSREWLLSLDEFLFELPFAALPDPERQGRYLLEDHSLSVVPSGFLLAEPHKDPPSDLMLAVGDPIYNAADPRREPAAPRLVPAGRSVEPLQLPRLIGSAREVEAVAAVWSASGRPVRRYLGADAAATPTQLAGGAPRVFHLAAHIVVSPPSGLNPPADFGWLRRPTDVAVALGQEAGGDYRFLAPAEIAAQRLPGALVVLNGCGSGSAAAFPGAGLLGLTHAWLAAGADSVVATLWPTTDDSGAFFESFYRDFLRESGRGRSSPAAALRSAQLAALRSGTWRAQPRFWAAYYVIGKE
jgi:CHAT domain-containing protein